jgi:capsular exopolysaccharide synthesis family protein
MKNNYVKGGPDPNAGGYGGNYDSNYGAGSYGYSSGGGYSYGGYGGGDSYGGSNAPQRTARDYILIFRERIWYLIVAFFIIFSGSILYTFNKTKIFTAVATMQVLRDDPTAIEEGQELEPNQIRSAEDLNTQISVLNSGAIIKGVHQRLQDSELKRFMAPYTDAFSLTGALSPIEILGKYRRVIPQRMSLMVNIAYSHPDPIIASRVANLFAEEYINHNLTKSIDASMKAVEDLRVRADQQRERVEELELKLAEYREKHNAVSLDQQENIAGEQLKTLNAIKSNNKNIFDIAETKWNLIETYKIEGRDLWELSFIADQMRVAELLQSLSATKIQISSLSKRYREKHPAMISLLQTLQETESELRLSVENAVDKIYANYYESKENFEVASKRLAEKEKELISLSKIGVEYNTLLRDFDVQQGFLQAIVSRMTMQKTLVNLKNPNARIIDEAFPPLRHSSPNIFINLTAGAAGGLAVGFSLVLLVAFFDDRIKSAFDIEGTVGLSLLGIIPKIKKLDLATKAQAVASNADRHVTETFRSIYSGLRLNEESKNAKIFLTTSTVPAEGKSFVSSNLALTFANHGDRTLLIDGDLRLPNVARSLQLDNAKGHLDYLEGDADLDDLIIKEVYAGLDVLPTGGKSKNPTQILNSEKFAVMMAHLRDKYDRIVIDSPPLAAVSDALILLPMVDGVIYVIKFNSVKRKTAVLNVRRLWESNVPVFGSILNYVSSTMSNYYYSQYSDKSYRNYYISDDDFDDQIEPVLGDKDEAENEAEIAEAAIAAENKDKTPHDEV